MTTQLLEKPRSFQRLHDVPEIPKKEGRLYAITFDMDIDSLKLHYGDPYNNAYGEIQKVLMARGFKWQQGSVYFGDETINAVVRPCRDGIVPQPSVVRRLGARHPNAPD